MGWKNVKEHYRIEHIVQVTEAGICIGSPYIHNLIAIGMDGAIKKADDGRVNEDLRRYMSEFTADPAKLRELIKAPDKFTASIPVYTYDGGEILEKFCEKPGWPNVTHDGHIQYENIFSTDKAKVVRWAKENAKLGIEWKDRRIADLRLDISRIEHDMGKDVENLAKLEKDYPSAK